ncbi:MAG: DUF2235 domain-containing protein [Candidatus Acidiferrales bacterium]
MSKKIVFCADGTWERPVNPGTVAAADTNVYKLFKALLHSATQFPYYDDGVGADGNPVSHLLGGAMGEGLFGKIRDGYTAIAHVYVPGDSIFLFGFSRGAYTARSLAGMLAICGIPDAKRFTSQSVADAFAAYRCTDGDKRDTLLANLKTNYGNQPATIALIGVWDTVGALGVPGFLFSVFDEKEYGFLNTSLNPAIEAAYQALSIDERRREFVPTLWQPNPAAPPEQIVEQVWFSGVHSDVGGGYAETGLSDIAMGWMLAKALKHQLELDEPAIAPYRLPLDPKHSADTLHDSWQLFYGFPRARTIPPGACLANSVQVRIAELAAYRPANLNLTTGNQLQDYAMVGVVSDPNGAG